jgi:D-galactarolactone cycloisomerase
MNARIRAVDAFPLSVKLPRPVGDGQGLQPVRQTMFVRVTTEDGVVGWGEGGGVVPGGYLLRRQLAPALIGQDARDTDAIHARLVKMRAPRGTLGAIDIALWDVKGKLTGMPICQLLGGARRERVPAYASLHNYSDSPDCADELRELVRDARKRGFRGLKLKIGGRPIAEDLRYLAAAREAGGADFDLMADANQTYEMADAVRVGRVLEELRYAWFEEPLSRHDLAGYAALRAKLDIPIAGGEGVGSAADLAVLLQHRAVDITQPDVAGVGGFSEARFLPKIAQLWGAAPTWHVWNSPLIQVATLHVLANQEPWRGLSMDPGAAPLEVTTMPNPMRERVLIGAPTIGPDGALPVPTAPGLGVDVDLDVLREYALDV